VPLRESLPSNYDSEWNGAPPPEAVPNDLNGIKKARWKALYQAAMLELDNGVLPARIEAAKAAIHSRMAEADGSQAETEASQLEDALHMLDVLLRMYGRKK
jgi:hypothetical protein